MQAGIHFNEAMNFSRSIFVSLSYLRRSVIQRIIKAVGWQIPLLVQATLPGYYQQILYHILRNKDAVTGWTSSLIYWLSTVF